MKEGLGIKVDISKVKIFLFSFLKKKVFENDNWDCFCTKTCGRTIKLFVVIYGIDNSEAMCNNSHPLSMDDTEVRYSIDVCRVVCSFIMYCVS